VTSGPLVHSSERIGKTGTGGTLLTEAININLSLHHLERVYIHIVSFPCLFMACNVAYSKQKFMQ